MSTPIYSRPTSKSYVGNTNKMEVHDLRIETTSCQINTLINAGHGVTFTPDTLNTAHAERYDNCAYCLGDSKR